MSMYFGSLFHGLIFATHGSCCILLFYLVLQEFKKDDRAMLGRKELFKSTLRKTAHAWKRINELRLTGNFLRGAC